MRVLHLGSGKNDIRPGWVNIDIGIPNETKPDGTVSIDYDLRNGIPFPDAEFDAAYSSHFFEHLDTDSGIALMRHCLRVLKPGALFRNALPDARKAIGAYIEGDANYFAEADCLVGENLLPPKQYRTPIDYIDLVARGWNHKCLYDPPKLIAMLRSVGFIECVEVDFDPAFDIQNEIRMKYSFYVNARKS
jgi:predicted SAM-dependent methyltransferase